MLYWRLPFRPRNPLARIAIAVIGAGYVGVPLAATFAEAGSRVLACCAIATMFQPSSTPNRPPS